MRVRRFVTPLLTDTDAYHTQAITENTRRIRNGCRVIAIVVPACVCVAVTSHFIVMRCARIARFAQHYLHDDDTITLRNAYPSEREECGEEQTNAKKNVENR